MLVWASQIRLRLSIYLGVASRLCYAIFGQTWVTPWAELSALSAATPILHAEFTAIPALLFLLRVATVTVSLTSLEQDIDDREISWGCCAYTSPLIWSNLSLTRFDKIAIQARAQMAADNEAVGLLRVHMYESKCILPLRDNCLLCS